MPAKSQSAATEHPFSPNLRRGRKPVTVDVDKLAHMLAIGCNDEELAEQFNCSTELLRRRHRKLFAQKRLDTKVELRTKQLDLARAGDRTMLIWLGKNLIGQTDRADITASEGIKVIVERIG